MSLVVKAFDFKGANGNNENFAIVDELLDRTSNGDAIFNNPLSDHLPIIFNVDNELTVIYCNTLSLVGERGIVNNSSNTAWRTDALMKSTVENAE